MFKLKIRSSKGLQKRGDSYNHYSNDGYDEYGEYIGDQGGQGGYDASGTPSKCCVCESEVVSSHLVFIISKDVEYSIHTSCLITSMALLSNGVALVAGFFKRRSKSKKDQLE
jgi:hypothetical protein